MNIRIISHMATGYGPDGEEAELINLDWSSPTGQMYSTLEDLNKVSFCTI